MIIVMAGDATPEEIEGVVAKVRDIGAEPEVSEGSSRTVIGAVGDDRSIGQIPWEALPGVARTVTLTEPPKQVGRETHPEDTIIDVGGHRLGGGSLTVIAGPCAVESRDQVMRAAEAAQQGGAHILRGDAFKPRTSPYSFQGLGEAGLQIMAEARDVLGMPFVAEVLDPRDVELVSSYADIVRIGSRNMANFRLLQEVGRLDKPVQLKRGFTATIDEWLNAAEYIYREGNHEVILVERGIRTFENTTRNTLDIAAVPVVHAMSHLPVFVDPSHAAGRRYLVSPLAKAAVAAGADGIMIDVHPAPETALVDGAQALLPEEFVVFMEELRTLAAALGRPL